MNRRLVTFQISRLRSRRKYPLQNAQPIVSLDLSKEVCDNLIKIVNIAAKSSLVQEGSPSAESEVVPKVRWLAEPAMASLCSDI